MWKQRLSIGGRQYGVYIHKISFLINVVNTCVDAMEAGETVIGTKAFDCVNATTLFQKLTAFGLLTGSSPT